METGAEVSGSMGSSEMKKANPFYKSKAWRRCREIALERDNYLCQLCLQQGRLTPAAVVHHIEHLEDAPSRSLDLSNLQSVCDPCHNRLHPEKGGGKKLKDTKRKARIIYLGPNQEF